MGGIEQSLRERRCSLGAKQLYGSEPRISNVIAYSGNPSMWLLDLGLPVLYCLHSFLDLCRCISGTMEVLSAVQALLTSGPLFLYMAVLQVLRLLKYLVAFGYYSASSDIEELLTPLLGVLDGRNDMPFHGGKLCGTEFSVADHDVVCMTF